MGARVDYSNVIEFDEGTWFDGTVWRYAYTEITPEFISDVVSDPQIQYIQVSNILPEEAFLRIDELLAERPDVKFRIYDLNRRKRMDLDVLSVMPHLKRLQIGAYMSDGEDILNLEALGRLEALKSISLELYNQKDYHFIQNLSENLEDLGIYADTQGGAVDFDCRWLLRFQKLNSLYLGKKARKRIKVIAELPELDSLALRAIKLKDFEFLREKELSSLAILYCGMSDLSSLCCFESLRCLELWRVLNLEDISFISTLRSLEELSLQDLSHIQKLPDLSNLKQLRRIFINNVPLDEALIPKEIKSLIRRWK